MNHENAAVAPAARKAGLLLPAPRRAGQSLVELAILIPIFMVLLLPLVDYAFAMHASMTVISATRDGARIATDSSTTDAEIRTTIRSSVVPYTIPSDSDIAITRVTNTSPKTVTVQVTYRYTAIFPFTRNLWGGGTRNITMRRVARLP